MTLVQAYGLSFAVIVAYMTVLWIVSLVLRDASIADIFWGLGYVLLAVYHFSMGHGFLPRRLLGLVLVAIWGLRLSIHILQRNWGRGEDRRYRKWRTEAGPKFWWYSYLQVFLLQGALMGLISAPIAAVQFGALPQRLTVLDVLGAAVWGVGLFFEAVGDYQLDRFKRDPANKGKVLDTGLWALTRHPNYFGDATVWWGFYILALGARGYWTVYGPVLMTILLLRVSGVALLEKNLQETKPQYRDYVERTSAFFPWFPRKKTGRPDRFRKT
jgi:steroid 5-alpha reductase family enzyme